MRCKIQVLATSDAHARVRAIITMLLKRRMNILTTLTPIQFVLSRTSGFYLDVTNLSPFQYAWDDSQFNSDRDGSNNKAGMCEHRASYPSNLIFEIGS